MPCRFQEPEESGRDASRRTGYRSFPWMECVYRAPAIYNVRWSLESRDYEGNVMRVVRRQVVEKEGGETVSYDVPVL